MRRVLREVGGDYSETYRRIGALTLIVAILVVWVSINTVMNPSPSMISTDIRYVVGPSNTDNCLKTWKFGDTIICKTYAKYVVGTKSWKINSAFIPIIKYGSTPTDADSMFNLHGKGSFTGDGVVVAVIDTGIDYTHPAFDNAIIEMWTVFFKASSGGFVHWIMGVNGSTRDLIALDQGLRDLSGEYAFADELGHGTHVAGIIAGRYIENFVGFAPNAKLFVVKAFYKNGTASADMVIDALQIVYDNADRLKIKVVNLSWGALLNSDGTDPISVAAGKLAEKDILVFAAAGNEGNLPFKILSPAVHPYVIALGAIDPDTGKIAPFSSWGTTIDLRMKPDFVAAGVSIVSARSSFSNLPPWNHDNRLTCLSGTSMSTAVASGIGAVYAEYWEKTSSRVSLREGFISFEKNMADRINPFYKDFVSGLGVLVTP